MKRKVCVVTGSRAEWGLLSPIASRLAQRDDVELQIVATNMHLMQRYGLTVDNIRADGFKVDAEVPMDPRSDSQCHTAMAMGLCLSGMAEAFDKLQPDIVVILGDRYEMLSVAAAATVMRIPIAHLHGGEVSEGAIDDSIRHAITKLSALHLTSAAQHASRVIQMGENPHAVHNIGAVGVWNATNVAPLPKSELESFLGIRLDRRSLLVTYHPVTADSRTPATLFGNLLQALDSFPDSTIVFTYPNNDARGHRLIEMTDDYVRANPHRAVAFPSLGMRRYLSALHYAGAAVGNSSSGIIEVPSMHIPSVDIGARQQGRLAASSVIHTADSPQAIVKAIAKALSPKMQALASKVENPYFQPDTPLRAATIIATTPLHLLTHKQFHDLPAI